MIVKVTQNIAIGDNVKEDWAKARKAVAGVEGLGPLYFQFYASGKWNTGPFSGSLDEPVLLDKIAPKFARYKRTTLQPTNGSVVQVVAFFESEQANEDEVSAAHKLHEERAVAAKIRKQAAADRMAKMAERGIKPGRQK